MRMDIVSTHTWQPWQGSLVDMLLFVAFASSKREARELITTGAISVNNRRITDVTAILTERDAIDGQLIVLRRGKRRVHVLELPPPVRLVVVEDPTLADGIVHIDGPCDAESVASMMR